MTALFVAKDVRMHYETANGILHALNGISFEVKKGEAFGIVGESGSGKTSLAIGLLRLLPKNAVNYGGYLSLGGEDIMNLSENEFRRKVRWKKISMVFQGAMNSLNPVMKVGDQITEPLREEKIPKSEARNRAIRMLELVGLSDEVFARYPHELSGGMKQRVVIAMSLVQNPQLVILDEPTSALDVSIQAQIMNLLKRLKREQDLSMIFITHDIALASDICDRLGVVYAGEMVETGSLEEVLQDPKHPYTQALLASTPKLHGDTKPSFIPGTPPSLIAMPDGCKFRERCPYAFEPCTKAVPVFSTSKKHEVQCWLHGDPNG